MRGISRVPNSPETSVLRGIVVTLAVLQATVLGLLARRGSWLSDDLDFLVQGGRGFAPHELLEPVNDHIAPGLRFIYAAFATVAPLNYDVTVIWRILMQALAITLMGLLLIRVLGPTWWVIPGTALYALMPVSMPSFMSLSSGVNNLSAHVFGLLLLHATIDWYDGHRRRAVAYGPLSLLISLACWEKSGLILLTVAAMALYLRDEPLRQWLRRTWPFAAALGAAVLGFGHLYITHASPSRGQVPAPADLVGLLGRGFEVPLSAIVGGPWTWARTGEAFSLAAPPLAALLAGGLLTALLWAVGWRRDRRALLFWIAVAVYVPATVVLVSYGRFSTFGSVLTVHYHYWSDLSIPLTLAVVLAARQVRAFVPMLLLVGFAAGVIVSDAGFAQQWGNNPAKAYFATVDAELDRTGTNVNLWDTAMPQPIGTALMSDRRLSPVLQMAGRQFRVQEPGSEPLIVDDTGHIRPASFAVWSRNAAPAVPNAFCNFLLRGTEPLTIQLSPTQNEVAVAEWFVKAAYFSNRENEVSVELLDADGAVTALPARNWPAGATTMYLGPSQRIRATELRLRSADPASNLCVTDLQIGLPQ
ncbi:hypothetical protein [Kribbella jiaozuonensis]|uniref:Glycosyltransferase RgtA/B/C/D-like domain-containing protein n=1 Tax=Kribbella jiaozuonensis TaxID=2575441 RepID=A0A4U3M4H3_9ACTN|nr:hypothetical protein [Kribbella jiaozuonensis]TKK82784.1 hypothetical protein FDA38_08505 [Kribbella jiaozuonensis]